jgi:hypothetical protein
VLDLQTVDRTLLGETKDRNVVTEDSNALTMTDQLVEIALDGWNWGSWTVGIGGLVWSAVACATAVSIAVVLCAGDSPRHFS